jgi:hypothetical protein
MSLAIPLLLLAATAGYGAFVLKALGVLAVLPKAERLAWASSVGFGLLGVMVFPLTLAGLASPAVLLLLLAVGTGGLVLLRPFDLSFSPPRDVVSLLLWSFLGLAILLFLGIALAPPADADSLAYHFGRPRDILRHGRLIHDPMAVTGAVPLLVQLAYYPALALGGERALTLWAAISGLASSYAVFAVALRWLEARWAAALWLVLLTTPAMVFGLGSGQVEPRVLAFVLLSVLAAFTARQEGSWRMAALAGLLGGFFAGAKVFGLFLAAAAGLVVLFQPAWLASGFAFALAAFLSGGGSYVWNIAETGDPLFPALFATLGLPATETWNATINEYFLRHYIGSEKPVPSSLFWYLAYPFAATFKGHPWWDSQRTGLGPVAILLAPFALAALPRRLLALARHPASIFLFAVIAFYTLWFFLGVSQRIRHLLPVYPLLLLVLFMGAEACWRDHANLRKPLIAGLVLTLGAQIAGLALFARAPLAYLASSEERQGFLERNVAYYAAIPWIGAHLDPHRHKLLYFDRQLTYFLDVPKFYGAPPYQGRLDLHPEKPDDNAKRWRQLAKLGITHILMNPSLGEDSRSAPQNRMGAALVKAGCAKPIAALEGTMQVSRTLPSLAQLKQTMEILELTPETCRTKELAPSAGLQ